MVKIYHNPRCSKSRQTLQILEEEGIVPDVIFYLDTPPSESELRDLISKLGIEATQLLRTGESDYKDLVMKDGQPDNEMAIQWMLENPKLIERPIVVNEDRAAIGRPPESVLEIL